MKIAIIIPGMNMAGGIERVVSMQANYWQKECGYHVCIFTHADSACSSFYSLENGIRILHIGSRPVVSMLDKIPGIYACRILIARIAQYRVCIEREKPDIILSMMHGSENFYLKKVTGNIPVIGVNHISLNLRRGDYIHSSIKRLIHMLLYEFQMVKLRRYDAIVALSKTDCYRLRKSGCHSYYIPNPCSFESDDTGKEKIRKKRIIMVGRMDYMKGQDRLLNVWKLLAPKNPEWMLMFVGDGDTYEQIAHKVIELGLESRVELVRNSNDVYTLLSESSIFAFTSRSESFGMAILEALSCGLPVITYDCENGPRDLIDNYYNGFLIPDDNQVELAKKIQLLIDDDKLRENLMINAIKSSGKFVVEIVMKQWNDLLKDVILKQRRRK